MSTVAVVYQHNSFQGKHINLAVGSYDKPDLAPIGNDSISSLQVTDKEHQVVLFEHDSFRGKTRYFTEDAKNLDDYGFGDRTSSIIVEKIPPCIIFEHDSYHGVRQLLEAEGYDKGDLRIGNDNMSSIRVKAGYEVTLFENDGFRGAKLVVTENIPDLKKHKFGDKVSSLRVRKL